MGLEWVCGLLQPGFVRLAPMLHKTTLTTDCSTIFFGRECTQQDNETAYNCSRVSGKACSVKPPKYAYRKLSRYIWCIRTSSERVPGSDRFDPNAVSNSRRSATCWWCRVSRWSQRTVSALCPGPSGSDRFASAARVSLLDSAQHRPVRDDDFLHRLPQIYE